MLPNSHLWLCLTLLLAVWDAPVGAARDAAPAFKTLYSFASQLSHNPSEPEAGLIYGPKESFYDTTAYGGAPEYGTVFELAKSGGVWNVNLLYAFGTKDGDGLRPVSGVTMGADGTLYGTTSVGGASSEGTVYALSPSGARASGWSEAVLYSFETGNDGQYPNAGVIIGPNGVLYGTTAWGGASGVGTVFALAPPAKRGGAWTETVIYNFNGQPNDGWGPFAGLAIDANGALYGTTYHGGPYNDCISGCGTVYELTPAGGGGWTETVIHYFNTDYANGLNPLGGISIGTNGVLYGTTQNGGRPHDYCGVSCGVVFELTPSKGGAWTETVLHNFTDRNGQGESPEGTLLIDAQGTLFGTTVGGGVNSGGTAFKVTP